MGPLELATKDLKVADLMIEDSTEWNMELIN